MSTTKVIPLSKVDEWFTYHDEYYYLAFARTMSLIWAGMPQYALSREDLYSLSYARALMAFYRNDAESIIDRRKLLFAFLQREFQTNTQEDILVKLRRQLPIESIIPRTMNRICVAYDEIPQREFSSVPIVNDALLNVYNNGSIHSDLREIYKRAKLTGFILVRPLYIKNQWSLEYMTADQFRIETNPDDVNEFIKLTYPIINTMKDGQLVEPFITYITWTNETHLEIDTNGNVVDDQPNEYGVIPFIPLRFGEDSGIYSSGLWQLVEGQLTINKLNFLSNLNTTYSSWGVWLATNIDNLQLSPGRAISITGVKNQEGANFPPDLQHITPDANYITLNEYTDNKRRDLQTNEGIPLSMLTKDGLNPSGIARIVEREELNEIRASDTSRLIEFEKALVNMIITIGNKDAGLTIGTNTIQLSVSFRDEVIYTEPDQEYKLDKQKVQDGVLSVVDFAKKWGNLEGDESDIVTELTARRALLKNIYGEPTPIPQQL